MEHTRQGAEQRGFAQAGYALQQHVSACEQADQDAVDDILLADDDLSNFLPDFIELADGFSGREFGGHGDLYLL